MRAISWIIAIALLIAIVPSDAEGVHTIDPLSAGIAKSLSSDTSDATETQNGIHQIDPLSAGIARSMRSDTSDANEVHLIDPLSAGISRSLGSDTSDTDTSNTSQAQPETISELPSSTIVYIGGAAVPLSSYQIDLGKYLWIEGNNGLSQFASINQYTTISLLAYTYTGGQGEILEIYPSTSNQGTSQRTYFNFNPGYNWIPYRGDVAGKHYLLFSMNDQPSNAIIIDVKGTGSSTMLGTVPPTTSNFNAQGISIEPIDQLNPQPEPPKPKYF